MQTDIEQKALAYACECAGRSVHHFDRMGDDLPLRASIIAHARAIEQHEAFRQEVSDVAEACQTYTAASFIKGQLNRFIIPKPDPLVEALNDLYPETSGNRESADQLRAALAVRGLEIREKQ